MAKKFSELYEKMPPESRARVEKRVDEELKRIPLHKLRRARELTQKQLAETLQIEQPAVSKLEKRTDLYLSTLRNFVEAMNGELEVRAVFPDGTVILDLEAGEISSEPACVAEDSHPAVR